MFITNENNTQFIVNPVDSNLVGSYPVTINYVITGTNIVALTVKVAIKVVDTAVATGNSSQITVNQT